MSSFDCVICPQERRSIAWLLLLLLLLWLVLFSRDPFFGLVRGKSGAATTRTIWMFQCSLGFGFGLTRGRRRPGRYPESSRPHEDRTSTKLMLVPVLFPAPAAGRSTTRRPHLLVLLKLSR